MTGGPEAVKGPDGEVVGFECAECATLKTSEEKAAAHCSETDTTDDGYPTVEIPDEIAEAVREANPWLPNPLPAEADIWNDLLDKHLPDDIEYGPNGYPVIEQDDVSYPGEITAQDIWVNWALVRGGKQPVDPLNQGRTQRWRFGGSTPRPERSFEDVRKWTELAENDPDKVTAADAWPKRPVPTIDGEELTDEQKDELYEADRGDEIDWEYWDVDDTLRTGIILQDRSRPPEDRLVLIDWDDVRDSETGEVHPFCALWLFLLGGYAEISQSGEGIHQFVFGALPEGIKSWIGDFDIEFQLSGDRRSPFDEPGEFDGDKPNDLCTVEIYDGKRVVGMTGRHIAGTGDDIVDGRDAIKIGRAHV